MHDAQGMRSVHGACNARHHVENHGCLGLFSSVQVVPQADVVEPLENDERGAVVLGSACPQHPDDVWVLEAPEDFDFLGEALDGFGNHVHGSHQLDGHGVTGLTIDRLPHGGDGSLPYLFQQRIAGVYVRHLGHGASAWHGQRARSRQSWNKMPEEREPGDVSQCITEFLTDKTRCITM